MGTKSFSKFEKQEKGIKKGPPKNPGGPFIHKKNLFFVFVSRICEA